MVLAGSGGLYELLLIILVIILIFNGLKRQKIMNKVDSNLNARARKQGSGLIIKNKEKLKEVDYINFEEPSE